MKSKISTGISSVIILLLAAMVWNSCSKKPTEPPIKIEDNESYIYIELDGIKHLFTNKENNKNRYTKASLASTSRAVFSGELRLRNQFNRNSSQNFEDVQVNVTMPFALGVNSASYINISSLILKQGKSFESFSLTFDSDSPYISNTTDSLVFIEKIDTSLSSVKIRYEGTCRDQYNLTIHHVKVISEIKDVSF